MNDNYIPLSYLSQYYYCRRRAALLLLEQAWNDNEYTVQGSIEHERVHTQRIEKRGKSIKIYEYAVISNVMRLSGKCDCIEAEEVEGGCSLPFASGRYLLFPVEYKHGKVRNEFEYNIQLCAQAMCLEEMHGCSIPMGAVFYIDAHRRVDVELTSALREFVRQGAQALIEMADTMQVPAAEYCARCKKCSMLDYCMPKVKADTREYMKKLIGEAQGREVQDEKTR